MQSTSIPRTRSTLAQDLRALGVEAGMTLLLHSSLSSLGWVVGGPVAVIQAFLDVLTPRGTLVVPTHTADNSDPARWEFPSVPHEWYPIIREETPAFDPALTPSRYMGQIAETLRGWPGTVRSDHPVVSFAAWGRHAEVVTRGHTLPFGLGERSPLARIYDLDGWVLLLGVGYDSNTSFHLAEYRLPDPRIVTEHAALIEDGRRVWKAFQDVDHDHYLESFEEIGAHFDFRQCVKMGRVGSAVSRLFPQREAVDFALEFFSKSKEEQNR